MAILAIAVFHTFQPWFEAAADPQSPWALSFPWLGSMPVLTALGCINLLGAYGNHVFFLISGYFLLPSAMRKAGSPDFISSQARSTLRRAVTIAISVAFYVVVTLLISRFIIPIEGATLADPSWLLSGLEFIWVYLAIVIATPLMATVMTHLYEWRRWTLALIALVFALNAYIAFFSPGSTERGLFEWRKLMSAASYLASYLAGALLATRGKSGTHARAALIGTIGTCICIECALAALGLTEQLVATSFKSTSLLSFVLAVVSMQNAATTSEAPNGHGKAIQKLAASILGFYIAQSLTAGLWRPAFEGLTASLAVPGPAAFLLSGLALSLGLVAAIVAFDQLARLPLLKRLGLA